MIGTRNRALRGFTLIELLVVIGIIALLVGLLFPAIGKVREKARRVRAAGEVRELEKAWDMYYRTFDSLPSSGLMDSTACDTLDGNNKGGTRFMEFTERQLADGMKDPWGQLYHLTFDTKSLEVSTEWHYATRIYPANSGR